MDNMDTADCIASPPYVDFLINRVEVPQRTKNNMGKGPQLPSNVTKMIKYGVNLLEVSGNFDGQYIIAVACLNMISSPDPPQLQDYVRPESDCEIFEMSSRISLNCPIGEHRIRTPVKGHLCNHPQCFDYDSFIEINSAKPTWKCPLCNNSVCYLDIRIDQNFLKILNEAADNVSDVIISEDGSWMVDMTEKSQSTEKNMDTMSQNDHVPDTAGNPIFIQVDDALPNSFVLHELGGSADGPPISSQSTLTMPAVNPPEGSCNMVHAPPFVQQTTHHLNLDNLTTTQPTALSQPQQQGQPDQDTEANFGTNTTKQAQSRTVFPGVQLIPCATTSPHSTAQSSMQLRGEPQHNTSSGPYQREIDTTKEAPNTTMFTPVELTPSATRSSQPVDVASEQLKRGNDQQHYTLSQSQANVSTARKSQSTTMFSPVQLTPSATRSPHSSHEQLRRGGEQQHYTPGQSEASVGTTKQAQRKFIFTPVELPPSATRSHLAVSKQFRRGGEERHDKSPGQPQFPVKSGDAIPSGRMRGSVTGEQLEAARLEFLSPPEQPLLSRPTTLPPQQPTPNSKNVSNSGYFPQ